MNLMMIEARKGKASLNDRVSKESADKLIEELRTLYGPAAVAQNLRIGEVVCSDDGALESVEIEINSPGGSVFDGMRIYGELREMAKRGVQVHTVATGMAASMGSRARHWQACSGLASTTCPDADPEGYMPSS